MSEQEAAKLTELVKRPKRVYRDRKDEYIRRCVELENTVRRLEAENNGLSCEVVHLEHLLKVEREAAAKIGFGTLVKRWWRGGK
jgi:ribosome-binding ATPase YchF (GTP1/OBG family)